MFYSYLFLSSISNPIADLAGDLRFFFAIIISVKILLWGDNK